MPNQLCHSSKGKSLQSTRNGRLTNALKAQMKCLPSKCFENVCEIVEHEDGLESRIAVCLSFVVKVQPERRQNFGYASAYECNLLAQECNFVWVHFIS